MSQWRSKPQEVSAFCFDGTEDGAFAAEEFVSSHDIENCEVTWQNFSADLQGEQPRFALDVTQAGRIFTLEAGDYLYVQNGGLYADSRESFEKRFERMNG